MIRCRTNLLNLQGRINREKRGWLANAATAENYYLRIGKYTEPPDDPGAPQPFWGDVKWVYLDIQRRKCAYCERSPSSWAGDYAVEHFRPKRRVDDWPPRGYPKYSHFSYAARGGKLPGYHLLAYHCLNYAAACTQCNTRLKLNYFPTAAPMAPNGADPVTLCVSERPFLIYPIGDHDTDPENLIRFDGILPIAVDTSGSHDTRRAEVTIAIFALDGVGREELRRERSQVIEWLFKDLEDEKKHADMDRRKMARNSIRRAQSRGSHHSSCAKCFVALYRRDPARARTLAMDAMKYLDRSVRRGLPRL